MTEPGEPRRSATSIALSRIGTSTQRQDPRQCVSIPRRRAAAERWHTVGGHGATACWWWSCWWHVPDGTRGNVVPGNPSLIGYASRAA